MLYLLILFVISSNRIGKNKTTSFTEPKWCHPCLTYATESYSAQPDVLSPNIELALSCSSLQHIKSWWPYSKKNTLHGDTFTLSNFNISSDKMPESLVNGTSEEVWTLNTPLAQSDPEVRNPYSWFSFRSFYTTYRLKGSSRMRKQGKELAWRWLRARTLHHFR